MNAQHTNAKERSESMKKKSANAKKQYGTNMTINKLLCYAARGEYTINENTHRKRMTEREECANTALMLLQKGYTLTEPIGEKLNTYQTVYDIPFAPAHTVIYHAVKSA